MAAYDPKRTRPATTDVSDDDPPPVDALLAPADAPQVVADPPPVLEPVESVAAAVTPTPKPSEAPIPVEVPVAPAPDRRTARLAIVGGVAAATVAAVMLIRRARRR